MSYGDNSTEESPVVYYHIPNTPSHKDTQQTPRALLISQFSHHIHEASTSVIHGMIPCVDAIVCWGGYLQFQEQATRNTTDTPVQRTSTNKSVTGDCIEGKG